MDRSLCSLGLYFCVEADELFVVEATVAVAIVAVDEFDRLVDAETQLALQYVVSFLDGHDPIAVVVKLHKLTSYLGTPYINKIHRSQYKSSS